MSHEETTIQDSAASEANTLIGSDPIANREPPLPQPVATDGSFDKPSLMLRGAGGPTDDRPAADSDDHHHDDGDDEAVTASAVAATARLDEYQFWFSFIEEERPTADGRSSFMVSPAALEAALSGIVLPSISGKATPVTLSLNPGRVRLRLEHDGLLVETDLPLTDFANLPRNGLSIATVNETLRRLLATLGGRDRLHETKPALFAFDPSTSDTSQGHLTFKFNAASIPLPAEKVETDPPLLALGDQPLRLPAVARALARGLRHVSAFPKQTYYGPIVVGDGLVKAFSRDAVIEYQHPYLDGLELTVPVEYAKDLASLLQRARRGIRISVHDTSTALADDIIRYRVPKPVERIPQYGEMKAEALNAAPIELSRRGLIPWLVLLNAATAIKGLPTTVRLLVEEEHGKRQLCFAVDRAVGQSQVLGGPVPNEYQVGDAGELPMKLLLHMTGSGEFETMELRLTRRAGALIQRGDGGTLTCIFPFREAIDE